MRWFVGILSFISMIIGILGAIINPPVILNGETILSSLLCIVLVILGVAGSIKVFYDDAERNFDLPKSTFPMKHSGFSMKSQGIRNNEYPRDVKWYGDGFVVYK